MRILCLGLLCLAACGGGAGEGAAGSLAGNLRSLTAPLEPTTFQSPFPDPGGAFGFSAAFAGNYVAFGAPGESNGAGNVYLFDSGTGNLAATLEHPQPSLGGAFGFALAGNALVTIVGAPGAEAAYVFNIAEERLMLSFFSLSPTGKGQFGAAVAASAANFIVGAPFEDNGAPAAGGAYYFDCVTDVVLASFASPNPVSNGHFGAAVATIDFDVFIGAPQEFAGEGRVYHFNGLTGELIRTFASPTATEFGQFGGSVEIVRTATGATYLLVGAPLEIDPDNGDGGPDGRAHLFNVATGELVVSLDTPNPFQNGQFGARVASNGTVLIVAAPLEGQARQNDEEGIVYLFDMSGNLLDTLVSPNSQDSGHFGTALAAGAEDLLVGAPDERANDEGDGRGYLNPPALQPQ